MLKNKSLVGVAAAAALLATSWFAWQRFGQPSVIAVTEEKPDAQADSAHSTAWPQAADGSAVSTTNRTAKPVDIPGEVTYQTVSNEYPRAFDAIVIGGPPSGSALVALNAAEAALQGGDAHAGYRMYMAIARCQDEEIADQLREMEQSARDTTNYQRLLARNETTLRECQGIGPAEIARAYAGLRTAAENGDIAAQLHYPAVGAAQFSSSASEMIRSAEKLVRFREDSMRFLNAAAARGSVQALQKLASAYKNGTVVDRNMQKSYVYTYASYLLMQNAVTESLVANAALSLTSEQIRVAQDQARGMLERCCR